MLHIEEPQFISPSEPDAPGAAAFSQRGDLVLRLLRRGWLIVTVCLLLSLAGGGLYLHLTPPKYTASSTMMIDTRKGQVLQPLLGDATPDAGWIESQIGILKSQSVAAYVVKQLRLAE